MDINTFESFLVVAEEMNFSKAAERLFISQQSLSYNIQRMEQEYSVALFNRKPRLVLTPAGREMVKYARKIVDTHNLMKISMSEYGNSERVVIQLGMSPLRSTHYYVPIWKTFHMKYPSCSLELLEEKRGILQKRVRDGVLTLGVSPIEIMDSHLIYKPLYEESFLCGISRKLLEEYCPGYDYSSGISLERIKDIPFIPVKRGEYDNSNREGELIRKYHLQVAAWADHRVISQKFAEEGIGFCFCTPMQAESFRRTNPNNDDFLFLPFVPQDRITHTVFAYYSTDTEETPYLMELIDTVREIMAA